MKRILFAISLIAALNAAALAQKTKTGGSASADNQTAAQKQGRQIAFQSGTQLAAQLENTLDVRRVKPGDRVVLKTAQDVKQDGQVVIRKGSRLIGHVSDVQQRTSANGESRIGLVFDRLRSGSTEIPIAASILSIVQARSSAQANNAMMDTDTVSQTSTAPRSSGGSTRSGGGGGLLGGVGNTVGGVVNTTTSTVGNVAGTTTSAVGSTVAATTNTTGNLTGSLSGLQITQSSSTSAEGGSTLSLTGRNLRLESGATFNMSVSNSASAGTPQ
jgi:hypothetical protein